MNIIIDAMGGDNAPKEILLGAAAAVREYGVQITAVGLQAGHRGLRAGERHRYGGHYRGRRLRDH